MTTIDQSSPETAELRFGYTNYRGETSERRVRPISIRYGNSEYHRADDWLLLAFDLDKNAEREFSMHDMVLVQPADALLLAHAQCAPVAWRYERSHATVDPASQPDDWIDWRPHLDFEKPRSGRDIRNVVPLYALTSTDGGDNKNPADPRAGP